MTSELIELTSRTLGSALIFFSLFDGVRRLATSGVHRRAVGLLVSGTLLFAGALSLEVVKYRALEGLERNPMNANVAQELEPEPCPKVTEERDEAAEFSALLVFLDTGTLHSLCSGGERILFAPTQADLRSREERVIIDTTLDISLRGQFANLVGWLVWGVAALGAGVVTAYMDAAATANPRMQADRSGPQHPTAPRGG